MQDFGAGYLSALSGSHKDSVKVDAWYGGRLVAADVPISAGSLTLTAGQSIRAALSLSISDNDGTFTPTPTGPTSPFGTELRVRAGIAGGPSGLLGVFPIQSASRQESYRRYRRPAEPEAMYARTLGGTTAVSAVDRAQLVQDARFTTREQPTAATAFAEIARLVRGIVPWVPPAGVADRSIPKSVAYEDDRLAAIGSIGALFGMSPVMTEAGAMTLASSSPGAPVWDIPIGDAGLLVSMVRSLSRTDMHNAVVARGGVDGRPLQAIAYDPNYLLRWGGPFGRSPLFYESSLLTTQAQVNQAAQTRLATERAQRFQQIEVTCICNYALQLGDVVRIPSPSGATLLDCQVTGIGLTLGPERDGTMQLTLSIDPFVLANAT